MENSDQSLTLLLKKNGRPYARVTTNDKDLASNIRLNQETGNETLYDYIKNEPIKNENLLPTGSNIKSEIRTKLRNLCTNTFSSVQNVNSFIVSLDSLKSVLIYYKNERYSVVLSSKDNGQTFIGRFLSTIKDEVIDNIYMICVYSTKLNKFTLSIRDFTQNIFELIDENDHIYFAHGINPKLENSAPKTVKVLNFQTGKDINFKYFDEELFKSFLSRVSKYGEPIFANCKELYLQPSSLVGEHDIENFGITIVKRNLSMYCTNTPILLNVDLSNPSTEKGKGTPSTVEWNCYRRGFNILGICTIETCPSKGKTIVVSLDYPKYLVLTEAKNNFPCPACDNQDEPILIKTFLVCDSRAKFRFMKASIKNKEENVILESPSDKYEDYAVFKETEPKDEDKLEYDFIEVTTIQFGVSFNICQLCDAEIEICEENILGCGRAFHKDCLKDEQNCPVCDLPEYKLEDLSEIIKSEMDGIVKLSVPNQLFGYCAEVDYKAECLVQKKQRSVGIFMKAVSARQVQCQDNGEMSKLELQQNFVVEYMPELITNTRVNVLVVAELRKLRILSDEEENKLESLPNLVDKCRELYRIVPRRKNGITGLIRALEENNQSGAVMILSKFYQYKYKY